MRDSARFKILCFSTALCFFFGGQERAAFSAEPIMLSNDLSVPVSDVIHPTKKTSESVPVGSVKAVPRVVPMAARPASEIGSKKPAPTALAPALSPPVLETPSIDQIEAALAGEGGELSDTNKVPLMPAAPAPAGKAPNPLVPVLRASPPDFADPLPASSMVKPLESAKTQPKGAGAAEIAPPTLRISSERFIPQETDSVSQPPVEEILDLAGVTIPAPSASEPMPSAPSAPLLPMVTGSELAKPRLIVEGENQETVAPVSTPSVRSAAKPVYIVDTFRARKGESLRDVIRRWSDRAGIDLVWAMPTDITLENDFSYVGKFETALKGLVAAYPESGLKTTFVEQGPMADLAPKPYVAESAPPAVPPEPVVAADLADFVPSLPGGGEADGLSVTVPAAMSSVSPAVSPPPVAAVPPSNVATAFGPSGRWRALSGASMRQVLQAWSETAHIPVIWAAPADFVVRYSVNNRTDFGRAITDLLEQHRLEPIRPVGQIYKDPATGQSVVVIRQIRG